MKLLLICGGQSTEHSVSRMSCTNIRKKVREDYEVKVAGISQEGQWYILDDACRDYTLSSWLSNSTPVKDLMAFLKSFDCIFPVLHGMYGEDGTIQGLFEMAKVPYVGCRVLDSAAAMDKIVTKKLFAAAGIPQTPSLYVKKRYDRTFVVVRDDTTEDQNVETIIANELGFPCFVKASRSGSSVGCYKVTHPKDLMSYLMQAARYDRKIVVEKAIDCVELECAVLGNDDVIASRVGQIMPHGEFYTFESKYEDEQSATCIPAKVSEDVQQYIHKTAVKAFKAIGGHGLARCDFFLDQQTGNVYLNEVNTMPGFTNISMYPQLMEDLGVSQTELIDRLIALAKER